MNEMINLTLGDTTVALRRELKLADDAILMRQLAAKLSEYRTRLDTPNLSAHREASTNYKIWVLQQLIDRGRVDFEVLRASVSSETSDMTLSLAYLAYAWKVIENYCNNRGAYNKGGTGLQTVGMVSNLTVPLMVA